MIPFLVGMLITTVFVLSYKILTLGDEIDCLKLKIENLGLKLDRITKND